MLSLLRLSLVAFAGLTLAGASLALTQAPGFSTAAPSAQAARAAQLQNTSTEFSNAQPYQAPSAPRAYDDTLTMALLGDMGSGNRFQYAVAEQLWQAHQQTSLASILLLGDLLYPDGNFKGLAHERFEKPYARLLEAEVPFKAALGNHDHLYPFTKHLLNYWQMPAPYYHYRQGPVDFYVLDTDRFDDKQAQWLRQALNEGEAPWSVVVGHHPVYSSGAHGLNTLLEKQLVPVLLAHSVPLYIAGHDHNYERFSPKAGVTYIVSGGGGAYLRDFKTIAMDSLVRKKLHHFLTLQATPNTLKLTAIDSQGQLFDHLELTR